MAENKTNNSKNTKAKVLPFRQGSAFFMRRGAKQMFRNDLLTALCRYRQAYESDPSNTESCIAVAEILNQMQRYEDSNRLLLLHISMYDPDPECYFGAACNYYGMHEFDYAAESLETYLDLEPDGEFAAEAEDFLDVLDDDDELADATGISDDEDFDTLTLCMRAKHLIDSGEPGVAADLLADHLKELPFATRARNLLAIALYCDGDRIAALSQVRAVLDQDPEDVQARCSRILLLQAGGDHAGARRELEQLGAETTDDPQELSGIAVLQLEFEQNEQALLTLQKLYQDLPYDASVNHELGCCYARLGEYRKAQACYRRLLRIDPEDTVAKYYFTASKRLAELNGAKKVHWPVPYRVPLPETFRRVTRITKALEGTPEEIGALWKQDAEFRDLLKWALTLSDHRTKRTILLLYYSMGGAQAERALRDFLLRTDQPDALKREAFGLLKRMGAREPYMAYLESQWIQGRVNMLAFPMRLPAAYEAVLQLLVRHMTEARSEPSVAAAMSIYKGYLGSLEHKYPRISANQEASFAAALELLGCRQAGAEADEADICRKYRITDTRLRHAVEKFQPFTGDDT